MDQALSPAQQQLLQRAFALHQAGDDLAASRLAESLAEQVPTQADVQFVLGLACKGLKEFARAEAAMRAALHARPGDPHLMSGLASLLADDRRPDEALALLSELVHAHPTFHEAHVNRALIAQDSGKGELALSLCDESLQRFPGDARLLAVRGAVAKNLRRLAEAVRDLEQAVERDPGRALTQHNLAVVLNAVGEPARACTHFAQAARLGLNSTDLACNWAAALLEAGQIDAARQLLERVLAFDRRHAEAGRALSRLLTEYAPADDPHAHYRAWAEAEPDNEESWHAWMSALNSSERFAELLDVAERALRSKPEFARARMSRAVARAHLGEAATAVDEFEAAMHGSGLHQATPVLMMMTLQAGDPARTAAIGEAFVGAHPANQAAWAYLATAWRVLGDEREHWLCDYDRLIMTTQVAPEGASAANYARELATTLDRLHTASRQPADQSLRSGTQTSGALFDRLDPAIQRFRSEVVRACNEAVAQLSPDERHPFLSRLTGQVSVQGSWSVRLSQGGHHVVHLHPQGWMSSAFYCRLPQISPAAAERHEGSIGFGAPPASLGLDLPTRRIVDPTEGTMVLFPSYMWHGTIPFSEGEDRLTAAFDFLPA